MATNPEYLVEIERLYKALVNYGRHLPSCQFISGLPPKWNPLEYLQYSEFTRGPCTCGYDEALGLKLTNEKKSV